MNRAIVLAAALALASCATATPVNTAATVVGAYTIAASAVAAYEDSFAATPSTVVIIKQCDAAAWESVGPLAEALRTNKTPDTSAVTLAQNAVTTLDGCLLANGVAVK